MEWHSEVHGFEHLVDTSTTYKGSRSFHYSQKSVPCSLGSQALQGSMKALHLPLGKTTLIR